MQKFNTVDELVSNIRPVDPVYCIRPNSIKSACGWFKSNFPGQILYAVKTNPNEKVIKHIGESGINRFDVASISEIKLIKKIFPKAHVYYMNPVKSREHIQEAYFNHNIRDFVLDTKEELQKIIEATNNAKDLILYIRISISNEHAEIDLSKKFEQDGISSIIYTDIARDGMLQGVNVMATVDLAKKTPIPIIASGGIANLDDIAVLLKNAHHGIMGAITGRAIYEGSLDFNDAQTMSDIYDR